MLEFILNVVKVCKAKKKDPFGAFFQKFADKIYSRSPPMMPSRASKL